MSGRSLASPPLPVEPLLRFLADDPEAAAESLGVHPGTVKRWRQVEAKRQQGERVDGVTVTRAAADVFACRLGLAAAYVWGFDWW